MGRLKKFALQKQNYTMYQHDNRLSLFVPTYYWSKPILFKNQGGEGDDNTEMIKILKNVEKLLGGLIFITTQSISML